MSVPFRFAPWLAGLALVLSTPLGHAAFSGLYVFGDSLSDGGNAAAAVGVDAGQIIFGNSYVPVRPYASGTLSNGPVWVDAFAGSLGLTAKASLAGGTNFAFGGARTSGGTSPSLVSQAEGLRQATGNVLPADALYVVAGGGNNVRDAMAAIGAGANVEATFVSLINTYVADMGAIVDGLQSAGARHIVVWNTPNLGLTPFALHSSLPGASFLGSSLAAQMNMALDTRLASEAGVLTFDVYGLLTQVAASPASYGLTNVDSACGSPFVGCVPATALFWDGIHPTTVGHQILAAGMVTAVAAIPEPQTYALMLGGLATLGALVVRKHRAA